MLPVGTSAPDFILPCVHGPTYRLKQFRKKKHVVVAFLPSLTTKVNQEQMQLYQELLHHLPDFQAVLLGVCTEPSCLGEDFIAGLDYPILSDNCPLGKVGKKYHAYDPNHQRMFRTLIIIDKQGKIALHHRAQEETIIGANMIFATLAQLKT